MNDLFKIILTNDYLSCYFTGWILVAFLIATGNQLLTFKNHKHLSVFLSFIAWPLIFPFSFFCPWLTLSHVNNRVCSWILKKIGGEFTISGETPFKS